jgi:hypothetical protein
MDFQCISFIQLKDCYFKNYSILWVACQVSLGLHKELILSYVQDLQKNHTPDTSSAQSKLIDIQFFKLCIYTCSFVDFRIVFE